MKNITKEITKTTNTPLGNSDPYHYTECGLDYVYLRNGFELIETQWGTSISITHPDGLHHVIGTAIVDQAEPISGQQLRFMRVEMDMTQTHLGKILGYSDRQMVANWEREKDSRIPKASDLIVRLLYSEFLKGGSPSNITAMIKRLADAEREAFEARRLDVQTTIDGQWEEIEPESLCA